MAIYPPLNILVHLTLVQQLHAQTIQNGWYFTNRDTYQDSNLAGDMGTLISHFNLFVMPHIKGLQSQEVVHRSLIASALIPADGPIVETILETSQGDQASASLPSYCSAILTLRSGFGGKSNRGRTYVAGISEGFQSASRLDGDTLTRLQNLGNQLLSSFGLAAGINPFVYVIYSRKLGVDGSGTWTKNGIRVVRQTIARSVMGTTRHRKIGIGN